MANRTKNVGNSQNIEVKTLSKELNALVRSIKNVDKACIGIARLNQNKPGAQVADMVPGYNPREYLKAAKDQATPDARNAAALARIRQANTATLRRVLEFAQMAGKKA